MQLWVTENQKFMKMNHQLQNNINLRDFIKMLQTMQTGHHDKMARSKTTLRNTKKCEFLNNFWLIIPGKVFVKQLQIYPYRYGPQKCFSQTLHLAVFLQHYFILLWVTTYFTDNRLNNLIVLRVFDMKKKWKDATLKLNFDNNDYAFKRCHANAPKHINSS